MLFEEEIKSKMPIVNEAIDELIRTALENQTHPQDVLLVILHSFHSNNIPSEFCDNNSLSPYAFGPSNIGFSENTHFEFISWYFNKHQVRKDELIEELKTNIDLVQVEELSINIEKSIYLKFWEADMIIKYLYQLSQLCQKKNYEWNFEVPNFARDGSKQDIIRTEIRDRLKIICPKFYELIYNTYSPQLRNAIAHSQYYFSNRKISYLNFSHNPKAYSRIHVLTFDEWSVYFHNTVLLYHALIESFKTVKEMYYQKTLENGFLEIRRTTNISKELFSKIYLKK
jgi:hypothetical protein